MPRKKPQVFNEDDLVKQASEAYDTLTARQNGIREGHFAMAVLPASGKAIGTVFDYPSYPDFIQQLLQWRVEGFEIRIYRVMGKEHVAGINAVGTYYENRDWGCPLAYKEQLLKST